jgi:hypothetical protein
MKKFKPGTIKHYNIPHSGYYIEVSYNFINEGSQHVTLVLREVSGGSVRSYYESKATDEWLQECLKNIKEYTEHKQEVLRLQSLDMLNIRLGVDEVDFTEIIGG